jgi:hypothetical protein
MVDTEDNLDIKHINKCVEDGDIPSRSYGYRKLKTNEIKGKKVGNRTYLVMSSVKAHKAALPDYVPLSQRAG